MTMEGTRPYSPPGSEIGEDSGPLSAETVTLAAARLLTISDAALSFQAGLRATHGRFNPTH